MALIPPAAYAAIALVIAGGGGAWWVQSIRLNLAECQARSMALSAQIDEQNSAIEAVRQAGKQAQAKADAAINAAKASAISAEARRRAALDKPAPQSCEAAFEAWDK